MLRRSPFRYFRTRAKIIGLVVTLYIGLQLSLPLLEDLLHERGVEVSHTVQ